MASYVRHQRHWKLAPPKYQTPSILKLNFTSNHLNTNFEIQPHYIYLQFGILIFASN